ncbi:MAG: YafY family protein [Stappiaceae bacterium]
MRRAERLFRLVQILRQAGGTMTAAMIADELEISVRTVYRDIGHLQGSGLPIDGEAGVGYMLRPGFDLPPMTLTIEQAEALLLGARLVGAVGDASLRASAGEVLQKLIEVLPEETSQYVSNAPLAAVIGGGGEEKAPTPNMRKAIREKRKVSFSYFSLKQERTNRTIRPLGLTCFGAVWLMTGWCELRNDFRDFRVDRIEDFDLLDEIFADEDQKTYSYYVEHRVKPCLSAGNDKASYARSGGLH